MAGYPRARTRPLTRTFAAVLASAFLLALVSVSAKAADPANGTLTASPESTQWSGKSSSAQVDYTCTGPDDPNCDAFSLTLAHTTPHDLTVELTTDNQAEDWDLKVYQPNGEMADLESVSGLPNPGLGTFFEAAVVRNAAPGTYTIVAQPYAVTPGSTYFASAALSPATVAPVSQGGVSTAPTPRYLNYPAPAGVADSAGEPSVAWAGPMLDTVMFQAGTSTSSVDFDDSFVDPPATWTPKVSPLNTALLSADPIMTTDPATGRTYVSQLLAACSGASYSDDAGDTWSPSSGCPVPHGADHQTVGYGPARPGSPELVLTPGGRIAYYCSQQIATAFCGTSLDGGRTFGPSSPVFTALDGCNSAFHGHVKVGPDGTAYLPNERCNGQLLARTENNGRTWEAIPIPNFSAIGNLTHPSVSISNAGPDGPAHDGGVVYYANGDASNRMLVAISEDRGATWGTPIEIAPQLGLTAVDFPVVLAGDPDRAVVAFFGTKDIAEGNYSDVGYGEVNGHHTVEWHLYIAHTYDRGRTWTTVDATPTDPTQRGCLWTRGTTVDDAQSACRNLLDFNGITMDGQGRAIVGWADGCTGACVTSTAVADNVRTQLGTVTRQTTGLPLLSKFDGTLGLGTNTTTGGPPACTGDDPEGDAKFQGVGENQPALDILHAEVTQPGGVGPYTFEISVLDLSKIPSGGEGPAFRWNFSFGGGAYALRAARPAALPATFQVTGPDGAAVAGVTGSFIQTPDGPDLVRVVVPEAGLAPSADGARSVTVSKLEGRAYTATPLGLLYETATACDTTFVVTKTKKPKPTKPRR